MNIRTTLCAIPLLLFSALGSAQPPPTDALVKGMLDAMGGEHAFSKLGVLELSVTEEETKADGKRSSKQYTAYLDTGNLTAMRLELPGEIVIGRSGKEAWATRSGVIDDRPQTGQMGSAMLNQRLFPMMLPFSLTMDGVVLSGAAETSFEGQPAWRIAVNFADKFFIAPAMGTTWHLHVRRSDYAVLGIEFLPPEEFRKVATEGVRYRPLKFTNLSGAKIADQVLLDGIDFDGSPTGHVRVTKMSFTQRGPYDPALFLHPDVLAAIEEGME
jgi:hypothetical protein